MLHKTYSLFNVNTVVYKRRWKMAGYIRVLIPVYVKQIKTGMSTAWYSEHSREAKNIFKWQCKDSIDKQCQIFRNAAGIICRNTEQCIPQMVRTMQYDVLLTLEIWLVPCANVEFIAASSFPVHVRKHTDWVEIQLHSILNSTLYW